MIRRTVHKSARVPKLAPPRLCERKASFGTRRAACANQQASKQTGVRIKRFAVLTVQGLRFFTAYIHCNTECSLLRDRRILDPWISDASYLRLAQFSMVWLKPTDRA